MTESSNPQLLSISESAVSRVNALLENETDGTMLRIAVSGGGCSGFQYGFSFDAQRNEDDEVIEQNGIKIVVDNMSLMYVSGSQIDFVDDMVGASFQINNPNATASCGCGTSFST